MTDTGTSHQGAVEMVFASLLGSHVESLGAVTELCTVKTNNSH